MCQLLHNSSVPVKARVVGPPQNLTMAMRFALHSLYKVSGILT
jgi:hypothetical protein